ncbi:hypothetical protein [Streptomyces natalensis]|uniref:Uncharacterized protein n=1 Tax=Streptomyces natalensis ATCC 27448 TaxID=1240678 RepID=A0A0D7CHK2_9ACTN|nr:hypothetical protein [Streptomyces natalensis]KIZ15719.1 hypothetical protein SNA_24910 [Streptomyces natalensis ATCC 27448]
MKPLNDGDRSQLQSVAEDMAACTASGDHRVVLLLHRNVRSAWGCGGLDYLLHLLAEDIVLHAGASARTPYAKVVPEAALPPARYQDLTRRFSGHQEEGAENSGMEALCQMAAAYLNAVQRGEVDTEAGLLEQIRKGSPGDEDAIHAIVREIAALHVPAAQQSPKPPTSP